MMKSLAASSVAKAAALCICPVVGAGVVATKVPQVRKFVHTATAPQKPIRRARALPAAVERPCVPAPQVASAVPPQVPRVAQVLPQAVEAPTPAPIADVPVAAPTSPGVATPGTAVGPTPVVFGGGFGGGGFGIGGGGGGFILPPVETPVPPVVTPPVGGGETPAVPEPHVWVQMLGGFLVVGGAVRLARAQGKFGRTDVA